MSVGKVKFIGQADLRHGASSVVVGDSAAGKGRFYGIELTLEDEKLIRAALVQVMIFRVRAVLHNSNRGKPGGVLPIRFSGAHDDLADEIAIGIFRVGIQEKARLAPDAGEVEVVYVDVHSTWVRRITRELAGGCHRASTTVCYLFPENRESVCCASEVAVNVTVIGFGCYPVVIVNRTSF